jgi:hypothetical protein
MPDFTYTNPKTGVDNTNSNLPLLWNDCRNFEANDDAYGCCGIVKKSSVYQYCRRCHESMTTQKHRMELQEEFEAEDFSKGLEDWSDREDN